MPVYEYFCQQCRSTFEQLERSASVAQAVRCPAGHADARRLISVFAAPREAAGGSATPGSGCGCGGNCAC